VEKQEIRTYLHPAQTANSHGRAHADGELNSVGEDLDQRLKC
jgi:hypothetical protein